MSKMQDRKRKMWSIYGFECDSQIWFRL